MYPRMNVQIDLSPPISQTNQGHRIFVSEFVQLCLWALHVPMQDVIINTLLDFLVPRCADICSQGLQMKHFQLCWNCEEFQFLTPKLVQALGKQQIFIGRTVPDPKSVAGNGAKQHHGDGRDPWSCLPKQVRRSLLIPRQLCSIWMEIFPQCCNLCRNSHLAQHRAHCGDGDPDGPHK